MSSLGSVSYAGVGTAELASDQDDDDFFYIHGVAIGEGDVTYGKSEVRKYWPADTLREAAESLEGQPLVRDHINSTIGKIGEVVTSTYVSGVGVVYEAKIASHYEELVEDIKAGIMEVSVRAYHREVDKLEEDPETGAVVIDVAVFDNLSVVDDGASKSNGVQPGTLDSSETFGDSVASASSAAVIDADSGQLSVATLERSVNIEDGLPDDAVDALDSGQTINTSESPVEYEELRGDARDVVESELSGYNDGHAEEITTDRVSEEHAYVTIEHQVTGGGQITVAEAYSEVPYWVCIHKDGYEYTHGISSLSEHIACDGPFEAGVEKEDLTLDLENKLDESEEVYATIHIATADGAMGPHLLSKRGCIQDTAVAVVEEMEVRVSDTLSMDVNDTPTQGEPTGTVVDDELSAPDGIYTADGTWFAISPDEHEDDSTAWADDAKYPLTSCTGENSVKAAWDLRNHGDYSIDQETLERRIRDAADAMDCDQSIVGLDEESENERPSASMDELDDVYSDWDDAVNMTASELEQWAENPCANEASVDPDAVIERNMRLLETNKSDWDTDDIADAKRTISFISRMSDEENEPDEPRDGPHGCPSKWAISLLNWAYNPFDSLPEKPDSDELSSSEYDDDTTWEMHEPQWEKTTTDGELDDLVLSDWGFDQDRSWDDLNETEQEIISEHFMFSASGFPPDSFDDLACPVVTADGELHRSALEDEYEMLVSDDHPYGEDVADDARSWLVETASSAFDIDLDAEMSSVSGNGDGALVASLTARSDHTASTATTTTTTDMIEYETTDETELESATADEPVIVDRAELEELSERAERADDVEEEIEELSAKLDERDEATEIVEELSDEDVELLQESETTVVEAEKAQMIDDVTGIYAEELAQYSAFDAEELADRFSPLELRDRVEEHDEASLSSEIEDIEPEPEAGNTENEGPEGGDDEVAELRNKLAADLENSGWHSQAEKLRNGDLDPVELSE